MKNVIQKWNRLRSFVRILRGSDCHTKRQLRSGSCSKNVIQKLSVVFLALIIAFSSCPVRVNAAAPAIPAGQAVEFLDLLYNMFIASAVASGYTGVDGSSETMSVDAFGAFMDGLAASVGYSKTDVSVTDEEMIRIMQNTHYYLEDGSAVSFYDAISSLNTVGVLDPPDTDEEMAPGLWGEYGMTMAEFKQMLYDEFCLDDPPDPPSPSPDPEPEETEDQKYIYAVDSDPDIWGFFSDFLSDLLRGGVDDVSVDDITPGFTKRAAGTLGVPAYKVMEYSFAGYLPVSSYTQDPLVDGNITVVYNTHYTFQYYANFYGSSNYGQGNVNNCVQYEEYDFQSDKLYYAVKVVPDHPQDENDFRYCIGYYNQMDAGEGLGTYHISFTMGPYFEYTDYGDGTGSGAYINQQSIVGTRTLRYPKASSKNIIGGEWRRSFVLPAAITNNMFFCNFPIFESVESAKAYFETGDTSGIINKAPVVLSLGDPGAVATMRILSGNGKKAVKPSAFNQFTTSVKQAASQETLPDAADPGTYAETVNAIASSTAKSNTTSTQPAPTASPDTGIGTETGTDVDIEDYKTDLRLIFPFCLPFDLIHLLDVLSADPETPVFEFPFVVEALDINIMLKIDLAWMDPVMEVFRKCEVVGFVISLIYASSKMIKW